MRKLLILALLVAPGAVAAQSTGTPVFAAPYRAFVKSEFAASISDPGAGMALEGSYKFGHKTWDIGFRAGFQDTDGGSTPILLGADGRTRVITHSESFPLDGALTLGVGAMLADGGNVMLIPAGLSLGRRLDLDGSEVSFVPYFQPLFHAAFASGNSDFGFSVGLGVDAKVSKQLDLRLSGAIGDYEGVGFTVAFLH
jgi:opacity protein-like surface antigen